MKDTKFIELLNLYLDQQIEPADAALLEEEIARNPARRTTYQQYCRMHRACTVMFEQSRPSSDVGEKLAMAAAAAEEKIMAFPTPRRSYAWVGYATGLAAAACVAFVFMQRPAPSVPVASPRDEVVQINPAPVAGKLSGLTAVPVNYEAAGQFVRNVRKTAPVAEGQPSLEWMHQVQFTPIVNVPAEELVFDQRTATQNDQRAFRSRLPVQNTSASPKMDLMNVNAEKSAWQFEK